MANYRCSIKPILSRGKGASVARTAAYITRDELCDERSGETYDYSAKDKPLFVGIYAPKGAPGWTHDVEKFVNEIESAEKRKDAQLARPVELSLAHELTLEQNKWLLQDFIKENFTREGYGTLAAIHAPPQGGDERNIHAHLLVSLRTIDENGFSKTKKQEQDNYLNRSQRAEELRVSWEKHLKHHLERHGHREAAEQISHKTLEAQGIEREPTQHLGPTASDMERKGKKTERGDINREIKAHHQQYGKLKDEHTRQMERNERHAIGRNQKHDPLRYDQLKEEHAAIEKEIAAIEREERKAKQQGKAPNEAAVEHETRKLGHTVEQGLGDGLKVATGVVGGALKGVEGLVDFLCPPAPKRPEERIAEAKRQAETKAERVARLEAEFEKEEAARKERGDQEEQEQTKEHTRQRGRSRRR